MKLSNQPTNRTYLLIIIILAFLFIAGLLIYQNSFKFPEQEEIGLISTKKEVAETIELMETETMLCNNGTYIFGTVLLKGKGFFNDIYRISRSPENFIVRLKSPEKNFFGIFSILAIPQRDCDRIYLTSHVWGSDVPAIGIFAWRINEKKVEELTISKDFASNHLSSSKSEWLSPDGEKIIIAQPSESKEKDWSCDYRTIQLLRLREDKSEVLIQLPEGKTFDNGNSDLEPYCEGLNFGWLDESEIYYDIYDARTEYDRQLLERKTLSIE